VRGRARGGQSRAFPLLAVDERGGGLRPARAAYKAVIMPQGESTMVNRRSMIAGTALGGALSALVSPVEAADSPQATDVADRVVQEVARAVQAVRDEVARQTSFWELAPVRDQTRAFLRANGKFPDFIEVGSDVWQQVYDWHVRFQQPITLGRTAEGRYSLLLIATNVIMRTDLPPGFVGTAYDR